jgi:phenylacetate-CoA ligase
MSLGSWTRRTGFWALDALRGGAVRHHVEDIRAVMAGEHDTDEQLERLLEHASRTTPFYAPFAGRTLTSYPVIDRAFCRLHIEELRSSAFAGARLRTVSTSGSTGTPLTIQQDPGKRRRMAADAICIHEASGLRLGARLLWIHEWSSATAKSRRWELLQNIVQVRQSTLDDAGEDALIERLRRERFGGLLAYGSELWALARRIEDRPDGAGRGFGLSVVLAYADDLAPGTKARIQAAFGAPVVDRYGNSENGILAWTPPGEDTFRLNRASFRFELLRLDADEPAPPGELARVVLTDLYNLATPLIRYDTGDLAIAGDLGPEGPGTIRSLEGRRGSLIADSQGRRVVPAIVTHVVGGFQDLLEWQFIQERPGEYRVLVTPGPTARDPDELVAALKDTLGHDARVSVATVEHIPRAANRKYQAIVIRDAGEAEASVRATVATT